MHGSRATPTRNLPINNFYYGANFEIGYFYRLWTRGYNTRETARITCFWSVKGEEDVVYFMRYISLESDWAN